MKNTENLGKAVREEFKKIFEDYDFAAEERDYEDKQHYNQDMEAEISTALSFMQDLQGSKDKLEVQKDMKTISPIVKTRIERSIAHMEKAIESYLSGLDSDVKETVMSRMSEVNTGK